jgi:uncharacterized protein (DUF1800 family)
MGHLPVTMTARILRIIVTAFFCLTSGLPMRAADPPQNVGLTLSNNQAAINFTPHPAAQTYLLLSSTNLSSGFGFVTNTNAALNGFNFTLTNAGTNSAQFFALLTTPKSSNELLSATLLNRLAYGPTPDDIARLAIIGPQAYIDEQLAPETITEDVDNTHTNVPFIGTKFLDATELLQRLITTNVTLPNPGGAGTQLTNIVIIATNDGLAISILSQTTNFTANTNVNAGSTLVTISSGNSANISDLRAWHILRAVGARRQLLEVLLQFLENHFVTQYSKSSTYLNSFYNGDNGVAEDRYATQWEYLENDKWRQALLNPNCTFYDLLRISCESPAMIVYLDTVGSRANAANIANENFAREILELFALGVDNGYEQSDITVMSRSWAGWTVKFVHPTNAFNPFVLESTNRIVGAPTSGNLKTNLIGVWAFNFLTNNANTTNKLGPIFPGKTVPARFGTPWAGVNYQLDFLITNINGTVQTNRSVPSGNAQTNAIQAGYTIISHLANLPFTMEYISVKLCRLFVHDDFPNPTTRPELPEYNFYDYTNPSRSAEAELVHQCMVAWDTPGPDGRKGNIRSILTTIFNSQLFRTNANMQKVKTPLEFAVSTIRATRANTNASQIVHSTNFTAKTDGYAIAGSGVSAAPGSAPLTRMGNMLLFERDAPDGYPEVAAPWISAGTLAERLRFVQSVMIANGQTGHSDSGNNNLTDPGGLIRAKFPLDADRRDAAKVADLFIAMIFPGEGAANLNQYRTAAIDFLNTNVQLTNLPFSAFSAQTVSSSATSAYDVRVRGMVAMLLTFQRFQEQ